MDHTVIGQLAKNVSQKTESPILILPDDITISILSSFPTKTAMMCRLVCRRWRDLTLTRDFVDVHMLQNTNPMIIVANESDCVINFLDDWWKRPQKVHTFNSSTYNLAEYSALFSHAGLIVFKRSSLVGLQPFIIFNPVDCKNVRINLSCSLWRSQIYGVFLHPLLKEYCTLWKIHTSKDDFQYKILNLGPSDPSFKTISYPFGHRSKREDVSPLLMDNYLYWMLELELIENSKCIGRCDIMEYDIKREEFNLMPCPVPLDTKCRFDQTHILVIDGTLSFLLILRSGSLIHITIWRLENRVEQVWTSAKYVVMGESPVGCGALTATAVVDGKLALVTLNNSIFVCDLMQGLVWYFQKQEFITKVLSHQMSFASLSNCRSTIQINQDGQHIYVA